MPARAGAKFTPLMRQALGALGEVMKTLLFTLLLGVSLQVNSTMIESIELEELIGLSDHVLVVKITDVTMINDKGELLTDPSSRTGPGISNTIRLHANVLENGIIKTNSNKLPKVIIIPLWTKWHYSLSQVQQEKGNELIVLLQGKNFEPAYPAHFRKPLSSRETIVQFIKNTPNKPKHKDAQ